ncbi:hypothetical protein ACOSP7_021280 [Xanthoceras sorbifolium]
MKGKSFALNLLEEEQTAFQIKENIIDLWHKRLGLYHHQGLLPFPKATWRATKKLQLIHTDIAGP